MAKRLLDADITDRADGKVPIWDAAGGTHIYVDPAGGAAAFMGAAVTHSVDQNLNNGSDTTLAFDTESGEAWLYDTDAIHDAGSNTRLTVPTGGDGYWVATACIFFTASANGNYRAVNFKINGTDEVVGNKVLDAGAVSMALNSVSPPLLLAAGDYVECVVTVDGASLAAIVVAGQGPLFSLHRVGT